MTPYNMDMKEEKKPATKILIPEGWREQDIVGITETTSKAGNLMFIFRLKDKGMDVEHDLYAVGEPKKRWMLKTILSACQCEAGEDGVYNWDIPDLVGKNIRCLFAHEDNTWINRGGEQVTTKQHRIIEVAPTEIAWDE